MGMRLLSILGTCDPSVTEPAPGESEVTQEHVAQLAGGFDFTPTLQDVTWHEGSLLFHVYVSSIHPEQYGIPYAIFDNEFTRNELYNPNTPGYWMGDDFCRVLNPAGEHVAYMHWVHGDCAATVFTVAPI